MEAVVDKRLITADEFEAMARAAVFPDDERLELINGEIIKMAPQSSEHLTATNRLNFLFSRVLLRKNNPPAVASIQSGVRLTDLDRPEPDVSIVDANAGLVRGIEQGDIFLAVEVSITSLRYDRTVKLPLYAKAEVPEVWIVDLTGKAVHVYRHPSSESYKEHEVKGPGDFLDALTLPEIKGIPVSAVLGLEKVVE